jgi:hypothetical protein
VKACEDWPGEGGKDEIGWKVRRKHASELRCLTVRDILVVWMVLSASSVEMFLMFMAPRKLNPFESRKCNPDRRKH